MKNTTLTIFALLGLSLLSVSSASAAAQVGEQAPDFSLLTMQGEAFNLSDYKGKKPVYLIFWATWCPACEHEIPAIKEVYVEFGDKMMVVAINVSVNDSEKRVDRYIKKHELPYTVAYDTDAKVTRQYGVLGTPTQILIDTQGTVRYRGTSVPDDFLKHFDTLSGR